MTEVILIALGLAMDAFAVSVTSGAIMKKMHLHHILRIALFFGGLQAVMPIIGWFGGTLFAVYIQTFDHWIVFAILTAVGGKMLYDAFRDEKDESFDPLNVYVLFILAVVTSIDAFAVGITFSILNVTIWTAAAVIGFITFLISLLGVCLGGHIGNKIGNGADILGGVILMAIGFKILFQHFI